MANGITSGIEDIDMSLSGMRQLSEVITKKAQTEQSWATNYAKAEQKKRDELILQMGEVKIVNARQAYLDYGFEIPQGYNLKITPTLIGEGEGGIPNYEYNISYLAPDGWEITGAGEYISPDGLMTTDQWGYMQIIYDKQLAELQAAAPEGYEFVPEAQPDFSGGYIPPAGQYLPTQDTVNEYYNSIINSSADTATGYEPTGTIIDDLPTDKESYLTSEQAATLGYEIDEGWQLKLSPVVTADGISFMPTVVTPGGFELIRDEMGNDLFVSPTGEVIKADDVINPAAVGITVENPYDIPDDLKPEYALQWLADGTMKYEYLPDAVQLKVNYLLSDPEALFEYFKDNVPYQEGVDILLNLFPDIDPAQLISIYMQDVYPQAEEWSFWGQIQGGIGDLMASLSGMMDWLGWDAAADFLMTNTKEWQSKAVGYEGDATGWGVLFDPAWWGTTALRGAPATVGLILAGALTATGIGAIAGTGFWASVAAAVGGASASRMLESAIEAGGTYNEAINSGKSEQEASDMAQSVFNKNLSLVGLDVVQFGLAFTPLGKAVSSLAAKGLVKTAIIGGEAVITAVTEAGEEYLQEVFQRMARGDTDPWATDEEMQEIMALGGAMGLFFMGSGKVTEALKSNVLRNISPELYQQYIKAYTDAVAAGNTEQQASQIALDELAKTDEGKAAIQIAASAATTEIISNQLQRITGDQTAVAQLPSTDKILDNALKSSWQSKLARKIGSTGIGSNLVRAIDPRAEISRTSAEIKDVVGRAAIVRNHMMAVGIDMAGSFKFELRDISDKPSELFQFDNRGVSKTLSEGLTSDKPGTLEDIFLHPDKYRLTPRQKAYIDKMMVLVERGKNFLRQEGLYEYSDNFGEWIHRVVVGRTDENGKPVLVKGKPGRGSKSIGATRAYEKARQHETQAEGVIDGVYYDPNPENWMGTYIEDVFIKIGDARFAKLVEEFGETPSSILDRIRPDLKKKVELTKEQLAHITKLQSLANQALRIKVGTIPASSIRSVARHFPELVGRLNKLLPKNSNAYNQAIQYAAELENVNKLSRQYINDLEAQNEQLRKGIIPASIPEQAALPEQQVPKLSSYELPERSILEQGFIMMSPAQRNSLMQVYQAQLDNMERDMYFLEEETAGLKEAIEDFFGRTGVRRLEIVQQLWNRIQKRKDELRRITVKEYKDVTGRKTTGNVPIIIGEGGHKYISWEDALDGIVREFGFDDSEALYDALEKNAGLIAQVRKAEDKAYEMEENHRALKMTIDALANVSITNQEHIPADITGSESGVTPAQVPVVITQAMQAQLEAFGYSQDEINKMTPEQAWDLINGTMVEPSPAPAQVESLESLKQQLSDMLEINAEVETFTQEEIASLEKEIAERESQSVSAAEQPSPEGGIETKIPEPIEGEPEPGVSRDFWGYEAPVRPKGKGIVTQISMDDQVKLQEYYKQQGKQMPDATYAAVPVNSIEQLAAAPQFVELQPQAPSAMSENQRQAELKELIRDIKLIKAGRLDAYNKARSERRYELEKTRQAGILKGYIMQPMFGGKIYDDAFIEEINKWFLDNKGSKILGKISEVAGTLRTTKAALDFSGMFIQGLPAWGLAHSYLFVNPKMGLKMLAAWYKAFVISTASFFAPHISYRYLKENAPARMQRAALGGSTRAIDIFAGLNQKGFVTNLLSHKWSPFKRAEVAFVTGGEYVRNSFWEIMKDQAIKNGDEQQLVMFLDRMTGVMNTEAMGVPALARQIESSFIWFAPQYTRACLSIINHIFKGGYNGMQARRALGGMITAGSIFYMAVLFAQGLLEGKDEEDIWERILEGFGWTTDPITGEGRWAPNARFMSIEIGDRNYGIGGFWYGLVRLAGNISSVIQEEGSREIIDFVKIVKDGKLNRDNPFVYWWYSRSSPFTGLINDLATHRDFLGYPIETWEQYLTYIATRFEPIWMESAINPLLGIGHDEPGEPDGTILNILGELFGLRVNQKYAWQQFYEKAEELITHMTRDELNENQIEAWEKGKLGWKQLDERQQAQLLDRYPELKELMDAAEADSALRDDSIWAAWNERIDGARTTYYDEVASLGEQLKQGLISTAEYREKLSDAGLKYGASISTIESDPQYAEIYEYLSENSENGAEYEFEFSKALADYNKNIRFADDLEDENGNYDWDLRDARVKAFIDKWGMEMYDGILKYFELKKKEQGADELYLKKGADIEKIGREYWDIEPDAKDLDGKDLRAAYRESHPEIDAMLAFWGYGGSLQTREAYDIVVGWAKEYGISLSQLGKGLPPETMADNYFEYTGLTAEFSGNSAEAQLYRLDNPMFNDWATEQWGWSELEIKSEQALRLKVNWRETQEQYDALGNKDSASYIEDDDKRREARAAFLEANPEFRDDMYRIEALNLGATDEVTEMFVEYRNLVNQFGANSAEAKLYRYEHAEFEAWARSDDIYGWQEVTASKEALEISVKYRELDDLYDGYGDWRSDNYIEDDEQRRIKREQLLANNPEYATDRIRRDGYNMGLSDKIDQYVEYKQLPDYGYWKERYLLDNPDLYNALVDKEAIRPLDADLVLPNVRYDELYEEYKEEFLKYEGLSTDAEREAFLRLNPEFNKVRYERDAYKILFKDELVPTYVDWYTTDRSGYDDDWYLIDNWDFYQEALEKIGWKERDFSKVPTKVVGALWDEYNTLPAGNKRKEFRLNNPVLEAWLVQVKGYKAVSDDWESISREEVFAMP